MKKSAKEIKQLQDEAGAKVFDVRKAGDRQTKPTIPGSEFLDVNEELANGNMEVLLEQDFDQADPIVFVCNSGGKCGRAAAFLREKGYNAYSVDGGMAAWVDEDLPTDN